jgi:hypothetical protein
LDGTLQVAARLQGFKKEGKYSGVPDSLTNAQAIEIRKKTKLSKGSFLMSSKGIHFGIGAKLTFGSQK